MMQRQRVGDALAGDVGRRAVHGLEDRRVVADVGCRARRPARRPARRTGRSPGRRRGSPSAARRSGSGSCTSFMQPASMISSSYSMFGYSSSWILRAQLEEQAVGQLHDVGLVEDRDLLALPAWWRSGTRSARCACRRLSVATFRLRDDAGHDFVFDAAVQAFGVLADDDHVDVFEARLDARQRSHRPHGGVEVRASGEAAR